MALTLSNTFLQKKVSPSDSLSAKVKAMVGRNPTRFSCRKKGIHPEFYEDAKVYCSGELVLTTGGTKKEYVVDVWSGNHPFYQGDRSHLTVMDSQLEKFRKKYPDLHPSWLEIPVLKGEIVLPPKKKSQKKK